MNLLIALGIILLRIGYVLAVVLSIQENHSILWATVHGCLGWLYVAYYAMTVGSTS